MGKKFIFRVRKEVYLQTVTKKVFEKHLIEITQWKCPRIN